MMTKNKEHEITLGLAWSRIIGSQELADVEFADDVALITDTIDGAKMLLNKKSVELVMNCSKIKFMTLNILEERAVRSVAGSTVKQLEKVNDFVYLRARIGTKKRDLRVRNAEA